MATEQRLAAPLRRVGPRPSDPHYPFYYKVINHNRGRQCSASGAPAGPGPDTAKSLGTPVAISSIASRLKTVRIRPIAKSVGGAHGTGADANDNSSIPSGDTQMQKLQQGFTLIELMIVVAIIGILAALAVPAYQDYTIRSKVSEAASLAAAGRTAVDLRFSETGALTMPGTGANRNASLGLAAPLSYEGKYVNSVTVGAGGTVAVALQTLPELGQCTGDTITYSPRNHGGSLEWVVSNTGTCPEKYRPKR